MKAKMLNIGFIAFLICSTGFFSNVFASEKTAEAKDYLIQDKKFEKTITIYLSDFKVRYSGYITLTDNDKDVVSISPNGFLEIEKVVFGSTRKIRIESDSKGNLTREYFEGRSEKNYENSGKEWLADILPQVVQSTGVGAEFRVERIYKSKGMRGLLEEIEEVEDENPAARNLYFVIMIDQLQLSQSDLLMAVPRMESVVSNSTKGTLMRNILSKYKITPELAVAILETTSTHSYNTERGSTLRVFNNHFIEKDPVLEVYFDILSDMSINSEKGNVLKDLMGKQKLTPSTWERIFENLDDFSLTREQGAILLRSIDFMPMDANTVRAFTDAVEEMDGHYYVLKGEIMEALLNKQLNGEKRSSGGVSSEVVNQMLRTTLSISSNSQKGMTLRKINRMLPADKGVYENYLDAVLNISDKIERYNVLLDFMHVHSMNVDAYKMVLEATESFNNDYQHAKGAVLRDVLTGMPNERVLWDEFFDIVNDMDQNSTIEEILRLILQRDELAKEEYFILKAIEATDRIDVDIETASVLTGLKYYNPKSGSQSLAYEYAAKDMKSDYLKRKVLNR